MRREQEARKEKRVTQEAEGQVSSFLRFEDASNYH